MNERVIELSVVIVNYKVPLFLCQALRSLREAHGYAGTEVIVVDNASGDDSGERVAREFPEVRWIELKSNVGFGAACNIGAQMARGAYVLFLNPDTVVSKNTCTGLVRFLKSNSHCGIVGPKILNQDGSMQASCRRSFPTPAIALYRFSGLSRLFPRSRRYGRYNLTYLDPDETSHVDAVSGSCMCMSLSLFRDIGGFDENFFMYGEDLDLCGRVKQRGFDVSYNPETQIIHFKGKSAARRSIGSRWEFYKAMMLFSRKYHGSFGSFVPAWLIGAGILIQAAVNMVIHLFKEAGSTFVIDTVVINLTLWGALTVRFMLGQRLHPYNPDHIMGMVAMHGLISGCYLIVFVNRGVYSRSRYSVANAFLSGVWASLIFMACVYFISPIAYSRIAFAAAAGILALVLPAWRELLPRILSRYRRLVSTTGDVIIVGNDDIARALIRNVETDKTARILGIVWPGREKTSPQFSGYHVLGVMHEIRTILEREHADVLLVATVDQWYSHIIEALSSRKIKNLSVRWVPRWVFDQDTRVLPETIPLTDFSV